MKISLDFKGQTATEEFGKLTLLTGPNGSGKSARLEALRFAVQGDVAEGKRLDDVAKYGSAQGCGVTVTLDEGYSWERYLRRNARTGSLSMALVITGHSGLNQRDAEAMLMQRVGRDGKAFAPTFDLGAFLNLSDDKRRDFVLGLCGKGGTEANPYNIMSRIVLAFLVESLGRGTVDVAGIGLEDRLALDKFAEKELASAEYECMCDAVSTIGLELRGSITEAIGAALEEAKILTNASKRDHDKARGAAQKLSEQKAGLDVRAEGLPVLKAEQDELREQLVKAREQIKLQEGQAKARESLLMDISSTGDEIVRVGGLLEGVEAQEAPGPDSATALDRDAAAIKEHNPEPAFDAAELYARVGELTAKDREARSNRQYAETCVQRVEVRLEQERDAQERAESDPWMKARDLATVVAETLGEITELEGASPFTEAFQAAWSGLLLHIAQQLSEESKTDWLSKAKQTAADMQQANGSHVTACFAASEASNLLVAANTELSGIVTAHQDAVAAWRAGNASAGTKRMEANSIRKAIQDRLSEIERLKIRLTELENQRIDKEQNLNALDEGGAVPIEQLRNSVDFTSGLIAGFDAAITAKQQYATLDEQLHQCIANAEREEVMHDTCKKLANAIRSLREEIMADLVKPLIERIRMFLERSKPGVAPYCQLENERGHPVLELGWSDGEKRTSLSSMSAGEAALFGAGLAYALVTLADPPLKLLLLEAAELDEDRLGSVLSALAAVSADLDHVIVASCHDLDYWPQDWEKIVLDNYGADDSQGAPS